MDGKKHKTTSSLLDTGADIPVISHKIALELGAEILPTSSKARDTRNRDLPLIGETTLRFACSCSHHRCRITKIRRCLIFPEMGGTEIIVPYDFTIALGLIVIKCVDTKTMLHKNSQSNQ